MLGENRIGQIVALAQEAGRAILEVYSGSADLQAQWKADDSPVTAADQAAHQILCRGLAALDPHRPILSEEAEPAPFSERQTWSHYWLLDPLDGTREFLQKNGEFTVNLALIEDGRPVFGVVHVPVTGITYWGLAGRGVQPGRAVKLSEGGQTRSLRTRTLSDRLQRGLPLSILASRRHGQAPLEGLLRYLQDRVGTLDCVSLGSSLKFCHIAEGLGDFYPRLAPTSEWDTAAAQAVVEGAGGQVVGLDLRPLRYNQKAELLNPDFFVWGDPQYPWCELLQAYAGFGERS